LRRGGIASFWILGLSDNCDRNNVRVWINGRRQPVEYVGTPEADHYRQINAVVRADQGLGECEFAVEYAGVRTTPLRVAVSE
jgi:hypothetical protein